MKTSKPIASSLRLTLLAALLTAGSVYAQTGSATDASKPSTKPSSAAAVDAGTSANAGKPANSASAASAASAMSKADQKMLVNLAQANMAEVKAGEMAAQKSQNEEVKQFAQKMVDAHGKALKEVQKLAEDKGVKLPDEVDAKHKAAVAAMSKLDGERFDKTYMRQGGVSDHKSAHKLVQNIQKKAKDPDLKALAAKLQPAIDEHLKMAEGIKDKKMDSKGASGTAGDTGSGKK